MSQKNAFKTSNLPPTENEFSKKTDSIKKRAMYFLYYFIVDDLNHPCEYFIAEDICQGESTCVEDDGEATCKYVDRFV